MTNSFVLDARLEADTLLVAQWPLCHVRLMNDAQYPWVILVPNVQGVCERYELSAAQRRQLDLESVFLSRTLMAVFNGEKLNVAALGNVVSQLHIHHVVRFEGDPTWPAPVWGALPAQAMSESLISERLASLSALLHPDWTALAAAEAH
mgnify:CR=1 FL=1